MKLELTESGQGPSAFPLRSAFDKIRMQEAQPLQYDSILCSQMAPGQPRELAQPQPVLTCRPRCDFVVGSLSSANINTFTPHHNHPLPPLPPLLPPRRSPDIPQRIPFENYILNCTHNAATDDVRAVASTAPPRSTTRLDRAPVAITTAAIAISTTVSELWQPIPGTAAGWRAEWERVRPVWQLPQRPDRTVCRAIWNNSLQTWARVLGTQCKYQADLI